MYQVETTESKQVHQLHVDQLVCGPPQEEMSSDLPAKAIEPQESVFRESANTDHGWGSNNASVPRWPQRQVSESPFKGFSQGFGRWCVSRGYGNIS
ncbi:hypothetical protein PR048_032777 [Dryococelus australis]|uniref:Uncharacterized protein n=1 Tax=Dryococelus australis TaxID=614101 RepID=A0ABQ9G358_9NEOP|nr:hypothetical protein PR048_032777 [Dryococelus australis]